MPRNTKQGKEKAKEKPDVLKKDYCFADDDRSSGREKGLNSEIDEGGFGSFGCKLSYRDKSKINLGRSQNLRIYFRENIWKA